MRKIKLVVIWHEGVTSAYHQFFKELANHKDIDFYFIMPPYWPSEGGNVKGLFNNIFGTYKKFQAQKIYDADYRIIIKKVNIIATIALLSITLLPQISFLRILGDLWDRVMPPRMKGMALDEPPQGQPGSI